MGAVPPQQLWDSSSTLSLEEHSLSLLLEGGFADARTLVARCPVAGQGGERAICTAPRLWLAALPPSMVAIKQFIPMQRNRAVAILSLVAEQCTV